MDKRRLLKIVVFGSSAASIAVCAFVLFRSNDLPSNYEHPPVRIPAEAVEQKQVKRFKQLRYAGGTDTPNLRSLEEWQHYVKEGSPTSRQKHLLEQSQFAAEEFSKATGLTARHLRQPDKSW